MISDRAKTYLLPAVLAVPPVVVIGIICNMLLPSPQTVPAVVAANDPEVTSTPPVETSSTLRTIFRVAGSAH